MQIFGYTIFKNKEIYKTFKLISEQEKLINEQNIIISAQSILIEKLNKHINDNNNYLNNICDDLGIKIIFSEDIYKDNVIKFKPKQK